MASQNIEDINSDLRSIPNAYLLSGIHTPFIFMDFIPRVPAIPLLGSLSIFDLNQVYKYWTQMNTIEKEELLKRFG